MIITINLIKKNKTINRMVVNGLLIPLPTVLLILTASPWEK